MPIMFPSDEKYDVVESMVERLDEMETKLNEQIERNVALNSRLSESFLGHSSRCL